MSLSTFPFTDFLAFIVIPFGIFFIFSWLIFYHLNRYGIKGDSTRKVSSFFITTIILISLTIVFLFFIIDWNAMSIGEFTEALNTNLSNN